MAQNPNINIKNPFKINDFMNSIKLQMIGNLTQNF